jgi:hypothetical protein
MVPRTSRRRPERAQFLPELLAGVTTVLSRKALRVVVGLSAVMTLVDGALDTMAGEIRKARLDATIAAPGCALGVRAG